MTKQKYILGLLEKFVTPMASNVNLKLDDGTNLVDATKYRQVFRSLQYLLMKMPNIRFIVNKLSQFMHVPRETYCIHLKLVVRYLKGLAGHDLLMRKAKTVTISAFSDADWGGDLDDHSSTSGCIVYLGSTQIISWNSAKKNMITRSSTEAEY